MSRQIRPDSPTLLIHSAHIFSLTARHPVKPALFSRSPPPTPTRAITFLCSAPQKQEARRYETNTRFRRSASFPHLILAKLHFTNLFASLAVRSALRRTSALRNAPLRIATHGTIQVISNSSRDASQRIDQPGLDHPQRAGRLAHRHLARDSCRRKKVLPAPG